MPDHQTLVLILIFLVSAGTLCGIFKTKTQGFGKYTSSLVLMTVVISISAGLLAAAIIDASVFANIAFAVTGFAGGLVTAKDS
jgi:hypothetical protein